ncbi:hypothetical protein E8E13_011320 [Curvularia kusanoi]|uniref:Uncharacterized protein n=1 Tax=Curvularia kusanoi TaxID=90978 RepID=A0A9P4TME1_CURKU|nr:hypothetical protein E8E13_011320 [Curvularia kusanoi]
MSIRVFLSFVWTSTNTWYGGQCLKVFLTCLWPSYANLNTELANGTMTTGDFVAFILFILSCLPLMWFSPEKYRKPFLVASTIVGTTVFALLIWSVKRAGGGGALLADVSGVSGVSPAKGGALGWAFVAAVMANIGGIATHMFSQSDYTRRYENSSGARAGVAFASLAFIFSQYGMVVASNAVVAGIDLAALLPRWFTLRRGGYFTIAFVFIMQPWQLYNSATNFLTVVGSFNVFLGPFMGIMFADYFLVRNRTMKLTDLFDESSTSLYYYTHGWNWRAAIAWPLGVWPLLPGLVQRGMAPAEFWPGWTRLYQLSWFFGFVVSGAIYLLLDHFWPMPGKTFVDEADFFGTFATEVEVLAGLDEQVGGVRERAQTRIPTEKDIEAHSYPVGQSGSLQQ